MKLKVCGMKYPDNIREVAALQPDYMGFIFYEKSPRYFQEEIPPISEDIDKVGVFVNSSIEDILKKVEEHGLRHIQLHGNESVKFCNQLKDKTADLKIIKVFSVDNNFDFRTIDPYEECCDYFLFDTKGKLPGGNGYAFDWQLMENYKSSKPYFLSGGIGLDSLEDLHAFANSSFSESCEVIDINSKFEINPGLKSEVLIREFQDSLRKLS